MEQRVTNPLGRTAPAARPVAKSAVYLGWLIVPKLALLLDQFGNERGPAGWDTNRLKAELLSMGVTDIDDKEPELAQLFRQ